MSPDGDCEFDVDPVCWAEGNNEFCEGLLKSLPTNTESVSAGEGYEPSSMAFTRDGVLFSVDLMLDECGEFSPHEVATSCTCNRSLISTGDFTPASCGTLERDS